MEHLIVGECILFSSTRGAFPRVDPMLDPKQASTNSKGFNSHKVYSHAE